MENIFLQSLTVYLAFITQLQTVSKRVETLLVKNVISDIETGCSLAFIDRRARGC